MMNAILDTRSVIKLSDTYYAIKVKQNLFAKLRNFSCNRSETVNESFIYLMKTGFRNISLIEIGSVDNSRLEHMVFKIPDSIKDILKLIDDDFLVVNSILEYYLC